MCSYTFVGICLWEDVCQSTCCRHAGAALVTYGVDNLLKWTLSMLALPALQDTHVSLF